MSDICTAAIRYYRIGKQIVFPHKMSQQQYVVLNNTDEFNASEKEMEAAAITIDPLLLSKNLQRLMLKMKGSFFVDEKIIDYRSMSESDMFKKEYFSLCHQLKEIDLDQLLDSSNKSLTDSNLLAFFINIYNALTIHSIAHLTKSVKTDKKELNILDQLEGKFWSRMAYQIDKYLFSLDDIEHGILRANAKHPATRLSAFAEGDDRLKYVTNNLDCRIHFALNCGAQGCPPISFYTPDNLQRGLTMAAQNFCTSETKMNADKKEMTTSSILKWYKHDFTSTQSQLLEETEKGAGEEYDEDELLVRYVGSQLRKEDEVSKEYEKLVEKKQLGKVKVHYSSYNWNINIKK